MRRAATAGYDPLALFNDANQQLDNVQGLILDVPDDGSEIDDTSDADRTSTTELTLDADLTPAKNRTPDADRTPPKDRTPDDDRTTPKDSETPEDLEMADLGAVGGRRTPPSGEVGF